MSKSLKELVTLLKKEIEGNREFIEMHKNDENTQVAEMILICKGKIEALENTLKYAETGSKIFFEYLK